MSEHPPLFLYHKFKLEDVNEAFAQAGWSQWQTQITRAVLFP